MEEENAIELKIVFLGNSGRDSSWEFNPFRRGEDLNH